MILKSNMCWLNNIMYNKYILFDGEPLHCPPEQKDNYTSLKEVFVKNSQFKVIEYSKNIYYKPMLEEFLMNTFDELNDNLFIIQDDVELDYSVITDSDLSGGLPSGSGKDVGHLYFLI